MYTLLSTCILYICLDLYQLTSTSVLYSMSVTIMCGSSLCCILPLLHLSFVVSSLCCILTLLNPLVVASSLCCILPLLNPPFVASSLSCPPPFVAPSLCSILPLLHHTAPSVLVHYTFYAYIALMHKRILQGR